MFVILNSMFNAELSIIYTEGDCSKTKKGLLVDSNISLVILTDLFVSNQSKRVPIAIMPVKIPVNMGCFIIETILFQNNIK